MKKLLLAASLFAMAASVQAAQDPEAVFNRACTACHSGALPTAPLAHDAAAWAPRLAKGMPALIESVTNGFNAMPPRGMCMDCTAEDYQAVIEWMSK